MTDQSINSQPRVPEKLGDEIGGRGRVYFENVVIDNVLDALLELSATVYAHRDRMAVLEKIMEEKGIPVSEAIETHVPDDAELAARAEERTVMVERIFGAFLRRPTHHIDDAVDTSKE